MWGVHIKYYGVIINTYPKHVLSKKTGVRSNKKSDKKGYRLYCVIQNMWTCVFVIFVNFVVLWYLHIDMVTDCILDSDRYRCFFVPNFRFRWFRNTDVVSVSGITVSDFVSDKKYENGNGFSVFRSFPIVFIPTPAT
jgi:hypothetical protein